MSYILLCRSPKGALVAVEDEGVVAEFASEKEAHAAADNNMCCQAWGYEVVEVDV